MNQRSSTEPAAGPALEHRLRAVIGRGIDPPLSDAEFDRLAREVFAFQFERNAPYRRFCESQGRTPDRLAHWSEMPAVPAVAFKTATLACFPPAEAVRVFHTSGTTAGEAGKHYLPTTGLYDAAILPNFHAHLLGDLDAGVRRLPMLVLTPPAADAPHSSLAHMMDVVTRTFGATESRFFVRDGALDRTGLTDAVEQAVRRREPVFLLGTAFAFVHWLDHCAEHRLEFALPPGSRLMETGGYKGRSRALPKPELYDALARRFDLPRTRLVNEYGMTELSTQFYDGSIRRDRPTDLKTCPPWARVVVIDPHTGQPAADGAPGLIRIWDLANLWSIACIQTEDLGMLRSEGFEVLGRAGGAELRGCSLNAESFAAATA